MKSKLPKKTNNDFYSSDDGAGRAGAANGQAKRDKKPSIYDGSDDDDYDYRNDLMDEGDDDSYWEEEEEEWENTEDEEAED